MIDSISSGSALSMLSRMGGGMRPPPPPSAGDLTEQFVQDFDTDGSGTIDKAEITQVLSDKGVQNADELADSMLSSLGSTDGTLTRDQVQSAFDAREQQRSEHLDSLRAMGRPPGPPPSAAGVGSSATDADTLFSQLDTDGNGSVTRSELQTLLANLQSGGDSTASSSTSSSSATRPAADDDVVRFAQMIARYQAFAATAMSSATSSAGTTTAASLSVTA